MARKIKIYSDTEKGCILFEGSTVEPKFIGTIVASSHPTLSTRIIVYRTDRFQADGVSFRILFGKLKDSRIENRDGENLITDLGYTHQEVVDYINAQANNFQNVTSTRPGLDQHPNFDLDPTSTSVIIDNGEHFGVNTIKAIVGADGLVDIVSSDFSSNNITYFEDCPHTNLQIKGSFVSGGPQDVADALNELFTVGAFESVVISDPYSTMVADVGGVVEGYTLEGADAVDPDGDDIFTYDGSGYTNYAGLKSVGTIDQPGEYFTFDIRGEGTIGFGLVHSDASFAGGKFSGNSTYADPDSFAAVNSAHYGFQFSHWFHQTPNGSWTNYGALTGYAGGSGWGNWDQQADWLAGNPVKIKVGLDENAYIAISSLQNDGTWVLHSRSNYPQPEGAVFHLGIKSQSTAARVRTEPLSHLLVPAAPTMQFRYVESPDGSFDAPLFATAEEANYFDTESGGSGDSHQHVYVDDPTGTSWYMPDNGGTMAGSSAPDGTETFLGNPINWTEITTLTDAELAPEAFSGPDYTFTEDDNVSIAVSPQGSSYTTTVSGLPSEMTLVDGYLVQGTTHHVFGDQTHTITVTRTSAYGSSAGSFDLTVTDDVPQNAIPGYTIYGVNPVTSSPDVIHHYSGFTNLDLDETLEPGKEISWTQTNSNGSVAGPGQFMQIGIVSSGTNKATTELGNTTAGWDLKATIWTNTLNHIYNTGWTDSSEASLGSNNGAEWRLAFPSDNGPIELYRNDVLVRTSAANYSGTQTLTAAVPEGYSTTTKVPSVTKTDIAFSGAPPAGFTQESGSMIDATTLAGNSVVNLDAVLESGKRMVVNKSWIEANVLPGATENLEKSYIGVPALAAAWGSVDLHNDFDAVMRWEGQPGATHKSTLADGSDTVARHEFNIGSETDAYYHYAIEWNGTDLTVLADSDLSKFTAEADKDHFARYSCYENYTDRAGDLPLVMATKTGTTELTLSMTGISFVDIPAAATGNLSGFTKALDFSGAEKCQQAHPNYGVLPLRVGTNTAAALPSAVNKTSADTSAKPWATSCVFKSADHNGDQFIWNQGEGGGSNNENIYLRLSASSELFFGMGASGSENECSLGSINASDWHGVYVAHKGQRLSDTEATASNLADSYDIRVMSSGDSFSSLSSNLSTTTNWANGSTGNSQHLSFVGYFSIGDQTGNYSNPVTANAFRGKVASMVVTTLKLDTVVPDATEIEAMITDPTTWVNDFKTGEDWRSPGHSSNQSNFNDGSGYYHYATQVWLMGDGNNDSYANKIRNQIKDTDTTLTYLRMVGMVSNDIESVSIPGLTN